MTVDTPPAILSTRAHADLLALPLALTVEQACAHLGDIKRDLFYKLVRDGDILTKKIGTRTAVITWSVIAYLERHE